MSLEHTLELAKAIHWAILEDITGLYHVTNNSAINKYDLLNLMKKHMKKEIEIVAVDGKEVDKSFIDTRREINYEIPSYDVMIQDLSKLIVQKKDLYSQYQVR